MVRTSAVVAAVVVLVVLGTAVTPGVADANSTRVSVSDASRAPGEYAVVLLTAEATNVTEYEANITFDASVIRVSAVTGADFPEPNVNGDNSAGWVTLEATNDSATDNPTLAGLLIQVRPGAEPESRTTLSFVEDETTLTNATDGEIDIDAYGPGHVDVEKPESTQTSSPTPTPTGTPTPTETPASTPTPTQTPTPSPTVTPTTERTTGSTTQSPTSTEKPTGTPEPSPTPTSSRTTEAESLETTTGPVTDTAPPTETDSEVAGPATTNGEGPGFGVGIALLTVVVLGSRRLYRRRDEPR